MWVNEMNKRGEIIRGEEAMVDHKLRRYTLLAVCTAAFLTPFMGSSINVALPEIGRELSAHVVILTWMATGFMLSSAALLLPVGRIADIKGYRPVFMTGIVVFAITSLAAGLARSAHVLIVLRILQGAGGACVFGTGMAMLIATYPPEQRGRVLGINTAIVYIGVSSGPVIGGFLTHNLNWRYIFFAVFVLAVISFVAALRIPEGKPDQARGGRFNTWAAALYTLGLASLMYGITVLGSGGPGRWFFAAGIIMLFIFVREELVASEPLLELRLLVRNRAFAFSNLAALTSYLATAGVSFLISMYLQVVKGMNPQSAGMVMLSQPAVMAVVSLYAGRISDRVEPRLVATAGMVITTAGLVLFHFLGQGTPLSFVVISLMVIGLGFGMFGSPNTNAVMSSVVPRQYGVASSTVATMRLIGQALSMTLVTLVIASIMGNVQVTPERADLYVKSMRIILTIFAVICAGGAFASMARGNVHGEEERGRESS